MSIRIKFLVWFNLATFVIILFFSTITFLSVVHSVEESIVNRLNSIAEATSFIIQRTDLPLSCGSQEFGKMLEAFMGYRETEGYVKIVSSDDKVLSCTPNILTYKIILKEEDVKRLKSGEKLLRDFDTNDIKLKKIKVLFYPIFRNNTYFGYIEVGSSLSKLITMKRGLLHIFLIVIPVVFAVANISGFIIFNKSFKPIIVLSNEMKNITAHQLYKRLPEPEEDDEIATLYKTINEMIARLEKSFEQIKQFSGDASHELRTPLTIMKGEVELALRSERTKEEYQEILVSLLEEIERMIEIIENLLLIAKSEANEALIDKKPVNVKEIVVGLCSQLEMFAEERKVALIYDEVEDSIVPADYVRLRQVLTNLIVNAIKYNVENGKVIVKVKDNPNGVLIVVEDTGIGIKEDEIPKIFDRFYRSDKSRTRSEGGVGLGLSICKTLIEAHGGYIDVESEVGKGSKFKVWLPKL